MKCINCGADFASDQLKCPYCGRVNEHALKLAKELQTYDEAYEEKRDELLETGTGQVLKHLTFGMGIIFAVIIVIAFGCVAFYQYRYSEHSTYEVTGTRLTKIRRRSGSIWRMGSIFGLICWLRLQIRRMNTFNIIRSTRRIFRIFTLTR